MTTLEEGYQIALDRIEKARITGSTKLDLSLLYLERLPIEILKLRNLSELTIIGHKFISFPEEITQLVNLTSLYLSGPMSAPRYKLPATIGRLVNLNSLHISFALTSLPVEIGQLINLKSLTLEFNSLTSLPKEISRLVALTSLDLSYNNFYSLPTEIGLLRNLTALKVNFNQITSIPSTIGQMKNLSVLDVHHNQLSSLPVEIGQLANLTSLDISHNQFSSFPVEIKKLVTLSTLNSEYNKLTSLSGEIGKLASLTSLNIRHNKISSVPREIGLLSNISTLNISYNRLISLPREISQLGNLVSLNARGNILTSLPAEIGQLINLKLLDIGNNELASLPIEIGQIINLKQLIIFGNQLKSLPSSLQDLGKLKHLNLKDNQLPIPPEILQKTRKHAVILDYYFSRQKKTLNECKMLVVGQGSVGKTSLVCRFIENKFNPEQNKTEGIEIYRYGVTAKESLYNINIWDFGGQEIMHATHQFFLTKRSLYLLVLDSRLTQEENRVEYWLKIIQSFSGESPVLIVGNKIDQHPLDIDRTGLQKKYPNIVDIFETSAATGVGMEKLRLAIAEEVYSLPHVRDELPESWFLVKKQLEEMGQDKNFIRYDEFLSLCLKNEVGDDDSQRSLIGFMHDLGVVLHFQDDPRLEALGILNPQWVTNGVYKILNSHTLFQNKGVLTTSMLDEILDLPEYPRGKRLFIVDMMKKFELCYDITPDKTFLVPDLLPKDQPAELKFNGVPAFEYAYPVLPTSVITRFIVRMNQKIDDGFVWRTGVVLKIGENKALVKADIEDRKITIAIDGLEYMRRDALSAIRYQLDEIHSSIKGLNPEKYIPIPNAISAKPLKYEYLLKLERAGKEFLDVEDGDELREVNISQILNGVESEYQRKQYGNVTKINIRGSVTGSTIIVGDNNQVIQDSYNKINSSEIAPELKETMKQLAEAVDTMIQKLPAEQAAEVAEDFSKLADEAVKPKPNQKWYSVSIEGLIKAAENLDKLGTPVISLSRKVLSLLTGGVVK